MIDVFWLAIVIEGLKIELELSASDANVNILSRGIRQPIVVNPTAGGGSFKLVRCRDSSKDMKETKLRKICEVRKQLDLNNKLYQLIFGLRFFHNTNRQNSRCTCIY